LRWLEPARVGELPYRVRMTLQAALDAHAEGRVRYRG
jgi:hypothetical protein